MIYCGGPTATWFLTRFLTELRSENHVETRVGNCVVIEPTQ